MIITLLDFHSGDVSITNHDGTPSSFDTGIIIDADVPALLRVNAKPTDVVIQRRAYTNDERRLTVDALLSEYDSCFGAWGW